MRLERLYEAIKIGKILKDCEFKVLDKLDNLSWEKSIIFINSKEYLNKLNNPLISGVICPKDLALEVQNNFNIGIWIYNKPKELFYLSHEYLINNDYYFKPKQNNISSKAIISPKAIISAHSVNIGSGSVVNDYAIIKSYTTIGKNTMIGSSSVIGGDGFEGLRILGKLSAVKHAGIIIIGDDVEIQALNSISKGLFPTRSNIINNGVKISDQVHINHGVIIGEETMIGPGVTISGNVTIGKNVWLAPGVVVSNRIKIGDNASVTIGSVVIDDVKRGETVTGYFAIEHSKYLKFIFENRLV